MSHSLLGSLIRLAHATPVLRSDLLPVIRVALSTRKLDASTRRKINALLVQRGLDGNGRFRSIGMALGEISEVIGTFGLEPDDVFSANRFLREAGRDTFNLAFSNPEDSFSPVPVSNSSLVLQWHKFENGNYEVIAYLS